MSTSNSSVTSDHVRSKKFRTDIQLLRAVAVLLVICYHASVPHLGGGYIGVDVFFVISGFVIANVLQQETGDGLLRQLSYFYARRIRRLIPAASIVLIGTVVLTYFFLGPNFGIPLLSDVRFASLFSLNFHFIANGSSYFNPGVPPSLVTHFWSLAVEEQFYLVFPILFLLLRKLFTSSTKIVTVLFLLVVIISSSWWSIHISTSNAVAAYYSPFTHLWELALGAMLTQLPSFASYLTARMRGVLSAIGLITILLSAILLTSESTYPGYLAWIPCAGTALVVIACADVISTNKKILKYVRPIVYVGDISYSFYLWHFVWLMLPLQYAMTINISTTAMSPTIRIAQVAGAFLCAALSNHFIERPIRTSARFDSQKNLVLLLLAGCIGATLGLTYLYGAFGGGLN
jgi:peptidoglycan/LPS O-acetylase OafA/YrhL